MIKKGLLLLLGIPAICCSQIPGLVNYNQDNGLNSSFTYTLNQDDKGFIWVGSDNGLFRFDGVAFKNYGSKQGLKNIEVLGSEPLANGEIFIVPFLNDFAYLKNNTIYNTTSNPELDKIQFGTFTPWICSNKTNNEIALCLNTNPKCIYIYKEGKVRIIALPQNISHSDKIIKVLNYDFNSNNFYFIFESNKLHRKVIAYNTITKKVTVSNIDLNFNESPIHQKDKILITQTDNNTITIYNQESPFSFKKIKSFKLLLGNKIYRIIVDKNRKLWVALNNGGILYFNQSIVDKDSIDLKNPIPFLGSHIINGVFVDRDNNVWFSSKNSGIFFIANKFFSNYIRYPIKNNAAYITAISSNSKAIFLGYNSSKGAIYSPKKGLREIVFDPHKNIEHRAIFANEKIAVFGQNQDAFQLNLSNFKKTFLKDLAFKNVAPYKDNELFICSSLGLYSYNYETKKIADTILFPNFGRTYTALLYDKDSAFVGSFKDLYKVNVKNKKKKLFLKGYYFTDIKKLKEGLYLGATNVYGIVVFDNKKILQQITCKNGLISNQVKKIDIENENTFWVSTNSGLMRIKKLNALFQINTFTQTDGLPSDNVAGCVIRGDTLYVGTSKGLGIFSIKSLLAQQKFIDKKVIINSVFIGRKEYFDLKGSISGKNPDNNVIFNLSFLDYASEGKIAYKYKVERLNNTWQVSNSSKIILNSVPPGDYTFKVYGLGYNNKQSDNYTELKFTIVPLFWQTWWFKYTAGLLLLLAFFYSYAYYLRKNRDKKLQNALYEKKIAELELQAIKAQINPHFIYNCLNSIHFLLYKKDYIETENYLDTFCQMIRKTLHYSEKTFMSIQEETEYLTLYLNMEKLRFKNQFDYQITVSENTNKDWQIPSLLIQPFVENAIKHGISALIDEQGYIHIDFKYHAPDLTISIKDNGYGIKQEPSLSKEIIDSFGIKLSQKRIMTFKQLFNTNISLEIKANEPRGTEIILNLAIYETKNTNRDNR